MAGADDGRLVNRFAANADGAGVCVLDGQTRPTFVHSAAEAAGILVGREDAEAAPAMSLIVNWPELLGR